MNRLALRQLIVGIVALPLSAVPFAAYLNLTPEGRLVRDKLIVAVSPPRLPSLSPEARAEAASIVPAYDGRVMALVYHGIGSGSDAEGGYVVSAARFGEHLAALRAAGMHPVTAADITWAFAVGAPLPDRAVMISFDDGRSDAMMFADPLLAQAGMKATMFVISEAAARPGLYYAGWGRLRAAARSGRWDIEAHSDAAHHLQRVAGGAALPALTSLAPGETPAAYQARVRDDLERNSAAILAHVGQRPVAFAYPFGAYGAERANDPAIEGILGDEVARRFVVAFEQDDQATMPLADTTQPRIRLRRLAVGDWSGTALLRHIARAVANPVGPPPEGADVPLSSSAPVTKSLPPIPFVNEFRRHDPTIGDPPSTAGPAPAPPSTAANPPVGTSGPGTTTSGPPATTSGSTSTTSGPTTTTTRPRPTTTTGPPPPPSTTTTAPPTTTTTRPPTTPTTEPCHNNGRRCRS